MGVVGESGSMEMEASWTVTQGCAVFGATECKHFDMVQTLGMKAKNGLFQGTIV